MSARTRVAVLLGAASGSGPAVARGLAAEGWGLALGEPCPDGAARARLDQVAEACRGLGVAVAAHSCDVRRPAEVGRLVAEAAALGPVEAAIALSTESGPPVPAWQLPPAVVEGDLDAHYRALVVLARAAVPHLLDVGARGRFVAVLPRTDSGAGAAAASAAGQSYVGRLALDLRPSGVTANAVLAGPGDVAAEAAAVVRWLCSPGSAGVTGASLPLVLLRDDAGR